LLNNLLCKEPDARKTHVRFCRGIRGEIPLSTRPVEMHLWDILENSDKNEKTINFPYV